MILTNWSIFCFLLGRLFIDQILMQEILDNRLFNVLFSWSSNNEDYFDCLMLHAISSPFLLYTCADSFSIVKIVSFPKWWLSACLGISVWFCCFSKLGHICLPGQHFHCIHKKEGWEGFFSILFFFHSFCTHLGSFSATFTSSCNQRPLSM